jgi:Tol biopolymer transport system component
MPDQTKTATGAPASDPALAPTEASTASTAPSVDLVGAHLGGRYRVTKMLGRGGMGAVYLAVDEVLGQEFALKAVTSRVDLARLRSEVLLAQKITHPNVCRTWDLEELDGHFYVKMEHVDGESLAEKLVREKKLPLDQTIRVAREVCAGLSAAHARGVIHCDLKPANILVERSTHRVVLTDFGVARAADEHRPSGGTPYYMAPEQVRGLAVDGRTDLYGLGCVLHHLLLGDVPFPADSSEEAARRQLDDPLPPMRGPLAKLVAKLLQKDPAARPQSANEVLQILDAPRRARTRAAVAGVALAALAAASFVTWRTTRHPPEWRPTVKNLARSYNESTNQAVFSPDGEWLAYASDRMERGAVRMQIFVEPLNGGPARRVVSLDTIACGLRWSRDGKSLTYMEWAKTSVQRVSIAGGTPELIAASAMGADDCGAGLALVLRDRPDCEFCDRLVLRTAAGDRELARLDRPIFDPRCDVSGRMITFSSPHGSGLFNNDPWDLWAAATDGSGARVVLGDGLSNVQPTFSDDGRSLFFSRMTGEHRNLYEVSLASGRMQQITFGDGPDVGPDVAPGGGALLYNIDTTSAQLFVIDRSGSRHRLTTNSEGAGVPSVASDDREVVDTVQRRGKDLVVAYPTSGEGEERVLAEGLNPAFTPDSREVVFTRELPGPSTLILAVPRAGGDPRRICEVPSLVQRVRPGFDGFVYFRPDGGRVQRVPLAGGEPTPAAPEGWHELRSAADGWRVAIKELPTGVWQAHLLAPGMAIDDPRAAVVTAPTMAVGADGKFLLYQLGSQMRRRLIAGDEDILLIDRQMDRIFALGAGGERIYAAENDGNVRRQLITNLDERPRLP